MKFIIMFLNKTLCNSFFFFLLLLASLSLRIGKDANSPILWSLSVLQTPYVNNLTSLWSQYVDKEFGTGVLKISPGHDHNDYLLARKLGLPILNVMNKDGTLNEVAGLFR